MTLVSVVREGSGDCKGRKMEGFHARERRKGEKVDMREWGMGRIWDSIRMFKQQKFSSRRN